MKKKVFISFLGITAYWQGNYCFDLEHIEKEQNVEYFGQVPLIGRLMDHTDGEIVNISFFVTPEVIKGEITPEIVENYGDVRDKHPKKPNNYEFLKRRLTDLYPCIENSIQPISMEMNESGMELYPKIVDKILSRFLPDDEVELYIDSTNCMRSVPLSMFTVLNVIEKAYSNVNVKGIYYWKDQSKKTSTGKEIYTIEDLVRTFNDNRLAEELDHFQRTMHITQYITQDEETDTTDIKGLKAILKKLEIAMQYVNIMDLVIYSRQLLSVTDKIINASDTGIILKTYLKSLQQTYSSYMDNDNVNMAINIAKGLYKAGQIQIGVTFLEAIYNQILREAMKKNLSNDDKKTFDELSENKMYKLEKYCELALCLRKGIASIKINDEYNKLKYDSNAERDLYREIKRKLDNLRGRNHNVCDQRINGLHQNVGGIIYNYLNYRNAINHGDGKKSTNQDELVNSFIVVLKHMYDLFYLNA